MCAHRRGRVTEPQAQATHNTSERMADLRAVGALKVAGAVRKHPEARKKGPSRDRDVNNTRVSSLRSLMSRHLKPHCVVLRGWEPDTNLIFDIEGPDPQEVTRIKQGHQGGHHNWIQIALKKRRESRQTDR